MASLSHKIFCFYKINKRSVTRNLGPNKELHLIKSCWNISEKDNICWLCKPNLIDLTLNWMNLTRKRPKVKVITPLMSISLKLFIRWGWQQSQIQLRHHPLSSLLKLIKISCSKKWSGCRRTSTASTRKKCSTPKGPLESAAKNSPNESSSKKSAKEKNVKNSNVKRKTWAKWCRTSGAPARKLCGTTTASLTISKNRLFEHVN